MVCADETANTEFLAADLLSQAEHGHDSQVVLLCYSEVQAQAVVAAVHRQMDRLPRKDMAATSIDNSIAIVVKDETEMGDIINTYAPEHLILSVAQPATLAKRVVNAGSVFMGHLTPESAGDYASGTNHTLPTNGFARVYSGVSLDAFVKKISYQEINAEGLRQIGNTVMEMAAAEQLEAHRYAVEIRLNTLPDTAPAKPTISARPSIAALVPYSSARDEFKGEAEVCLDANENPYDNGVNRYPDPLAQAVKAAISRIKQVPESHIMLGNGSDEVIDLLFRIFCEPGQDEVMILPPTYGMYQVSADIHNVRVVKIPLLPGFQLDVDTILEKATHRTKILWLCTPNNPSGNDFDAHAMQRLLTDFPGLVVVDEAYIDFANRPSFTTLLEQYPNLVVMQTLSKAWGMAGIRLGMAFASERIIRLLNAVKPPYNVNILSQRKALEALNQSALTGQRIASLLAERQRVQAAFNNLPLVLKQYPTDANFILAQFEDPAAVYQYLAEKGIIVRDRSRQPLCEGCLRVTIGTPEENDRLITALQIYSNR
ncbi:MAG: histidinol-phosphate transaminase [Saprospiraceae bacterium]